jgi:hypothetical protein
LNELGELLLLGSEMGNRIDQGVISQQGAELPVLLSAKATDDLALNKDSKAFVQPAKDKS